MSGDDGSEEEHQGATTKGEICCYLVYTLVWLGLAVGLPSLGWQANATSHWLHIALWPLFLLSFCLCMGVKGCPAMSLMVTGMLIINFGAVIALFRGSLRAGHQVTRDVSVAEWSEGGASTLGSTDIAFFTDGYVDGTLTANAIAREVSGSGYNKDEALIKYWIAPVLSSAQCVNTSGALAAGCEVAFYLLMTKASDVRRLPTMTKKDLCPLAKRGLEVSSGGLCVSRSMYTCGGSRLEKRFHDNGGCADDNNGNPYPQALCLETLAPIIDQRYGKNASAAAACMRPMFSLLNQPQREISLSLFIIAAILYTISCILFALSWIIHIWFPGLSKRCGCQQCDNSCNNPGSDD